MLFFIASTKSLLPLESVQTSCPSNAWTGYMAPINRIQAQTRSDSKYKDKDDSFLCLNQHKKDKKTVEIIYTSSHIIRRLIQQMNQTRIAYKWREIIAKEIQRHKI